MKVDIENYLNKLSDAFSKIETSKIDVLYDDLMSCWKQKKNVFFCGNGGSAGNAIHIVNDYIYGIAKETGKGLSAYALSANTSVMSCLANDTGYQNIFSEQLAVHAKKNDLLIVLSGSGNSSNIIKAIDKARELGVRSHSVVAYDGGYAKDKSDNCIHLPINDMQIAEDSQLIIFHMIMQKFYEERKSV